MNRVPGDARFQRAISGVRNIDRKQTVQSRVGAPNWLQSETARRKRAYPEAMNFSKLGEHYKEAPMARRMPRAVTAAGDNRSMARQSAALSR
jgi:hypothetical protein